MNILKRIWRIVSTVLVAVAVVFAVALVGVRLVGFEVYTVLSGSMEPAYHTGSVIWVQECEPEEVEVGDPITFVMNEDLLVATHRVIEIDEANQHFYTKGDANDAPDAAPVHFENLIGKPVFTVPHLGYFVSYIQQPPGLYVAVAVCALILMLLFIPDLFAKDEKEEPSPHSKHRKIDPIEQETLMAQPIKHTSARVSPTERTRVRGEPRGAPIAKGAPRHARSGTTAPSRQEQRNNPRLHARSKNNETNQSINR